VRIEDVDSLARAFTDPEVTRYVGAGQPLSLDEVSAMVERIERRFQDDGFGQLAVERREDGGVIGRVGLLPLDPHTWRFGSRKEIGPRAEIGWTLARGAWGRGYAFEAAAAVIITSFGKPAHLCAMHRHDDATVPALRAHAGGASPRPPHR
jgi:RimJ/RimL family protein N-acetyltransferase